jgi:WD40 repeat protein
MRPSVLAYTNGNLNIIDTREGTTVHKSLYKQANPGGLIKWNQAVPYWIATASTKSLNIYDIRYNSSSPVIIFNHSNINSLCWSPNNSDLILAASSDRRINIWSMSRDEEDCRLGMKMNRFEIGSLTASKHQNHVFYGLDDADSLLKIKIRSEYLALITPHKDDSEYKDIEEALYSADYNNYKDKLTEISRETFDSAGDFSKLKQLILLTTPSKSKTMTFDEKCLARIEIKSNLKEFKELLKQSTSFAFTFKESEEIQQFADHLRLKIRIAELLGSEDFESMKMFLNSITSAFCSDLNYLSRSQSIKLMALLLKNDRKSAFTFLSKIISSNPFGTPEIIQIWIWMSCYPTIFDSKSFELIKIRPSLSKSFHDLDSELYDGDDEDIYDDDLKIGKFLEKMRYQFYDSLLLNQQIGPQNTKIIQQLFLNLGSSPINFDKLIDTSDTILGQIHAALLEERGDVFIISAETIKLLLESALKVSAKNSLIEFFLLAFRLQVLTEKTPIYSGIQEFITSVGFSRLKFLLAKNQDAMAVNSIVAIATDHYSTLSEDQLNYLADQIKFIVDKISDFSLIWNDFRIENEFKSLKFKSELEKLKNLIN